MADQMTRAGSGRREHRGDKGSSGGQSLDGWSTVGGSGSSSRKTGDLSKFGTIRTKVGGTVSLAPGGGGGVGAFVGGSKGWKTENKDREDKPSSMARANSTSNLYSVLTHADTDRKFDGPSEPLKASPPAERKKLILQPRSTPAATPENVALKQTTTTTTPSQPISEEVADRKINNMVEEYFSIWDIGVSRKKL